MPSRARKLFPPSGRQYELFDASVLLLAFGVIGYVITQPPTDTTVALSAPLRFVTEQQLGWAMIVAAIFAIITSYSPRWSRAGYVAVITITLTLSLNFLLGYLTTDASTRTLLSVILYAWVARRLMRDNSEVA